MRAGRTKKAHQMLVWQAFSVTVSLLRAWLSWRRGWRLWFCGALWLCVFVVLARWMPGRRRVGVVWVALELQFKLFAAAAVVVNESIGKYKRSI
jgi:hypothetical protein